MACLAWGAPPRAAPATPPTATRVQNLLRSGRYAAAEREARRLLAEAERAQGADALQTADALDLLADALRQEGKSGEAEAREVCERAVRIKEAVLGPDSLGTARSIINLGLLLLERGQRDEAEALLRRALGIRERVLGDRDPAVARSLEYVAVTEAQAGRDSTAERLIERAIAIERATLPPHDPRLGESLNKLASIAYYQGDYARAGPLYEQVLAIYRDAYGPNHPKLSEPLNNLGAVYSELGDKRLALRYLMQALDLRIHSLGPGHWLVASTLCNIGNALAELGDSAGARARYERALRIQERAFGQEHVDVAWTLMHLGRLDLAMGRLRSAKTRLTRALAIQRKLLGDSHPDLSWTLRCLGRVYEEEGRPAAAREAYERAAALPESAYGPTHPDRILALNAYATFLARTGESTEALDTALRAADARASQLRTVTRGLGEQQALGYLSFGAAGLDLAIDLGSDGAGGPAGVRRAWDAEVRSRTLVLDEMASRQRIAAMASTDSTLAATVERVDDARRRYAALLVRGAGSENVEQFRENLDRLQENMERAERALAAACLPFRAEEARSRLGLDDVLAALPPDAALVSFVAFRSGKGPAYVAFVASPGAEPCAVRLGRADRIDPLIDRWTRDAANAPASDQGDAAERAETACRRSGEALRRRIWDPVAAWVGRATTVFIVPDGALYRVNFAALPSGTSRYLVESGPLLHVLTGERDLVPDAVRARGVGLLALGGPSFDRAPEPAEEPGVSIRRGLRASEAAPGPGRGGARGPLPDCPDFKRVRFEALPGAVREVEEIASLWPDSASAVLLTGAEASEGELRRLAPGRRVLHLATHGFFLDGAHCVMAAGRRGIGGLSERRETGSRAEEHPETAVRPAGSPLRLSGLALAGANRRDTTPSGEDDGVLTAEEVASLDLAGTEWAVLSACDTGVGRVQIGEGVLGLRRAFRIAGARTVIMSLWAVDDQATRRWMRALYESRFREHRGTAESVREADLTVLQERRARGLSTHPFYWAGFVAAGGWN